MEKTAQEFAMFIFQGLSLGVALAVLVAAAWDAFTYRLPDGLTLGGGAMAVLGLGPEHGWLPVILWAFCGFACLKSFQIFQRRLQGRTVIGSGDAKLMIPIGVLVGAQAGWLGILLVPLVGALSGAVFYTLKHSFFSHGGAPVTVMPFGPFLAWGMLCILAIYQDI